MVAKGNHHTEETKRRIAEAKRLEKNRAPLQPQLCACGCGEYAAVDERRNRVSKYVSGHNNPRKGARHSEETKAKIAAKTREQMKREYPDGTPQHLRNTGAHHSWKWMMGRCFDSWNASYPAYGGRGITVCERWLTFANFLQDMGPRPDGMSLDRIDGSGNYEPGNCRWATKAEQSANRRNPWDTRRAKYGPSGRAPKEF